MFVYLAHTIIDMIEFTKKTFDYSEVITDNWKINCSFYIKSTLQYKVVGLG